MCPQFGFTFENDYLPGESEMSLLTKEVFEADDSPDDIFRHIKTLFSELGIFGSVLSLEHEGIAYRICCDDTCFMVYRANDATGSRHHVPGWPVCLVTEQQVFEECRADGIGSDHHACVVRLTHWLDMVAQHARPGEDRGSDPL